jgi:pyruvate carboxylase subunit A
MGNPRFVRGDLGTHFIDSETTLMDDMKRRMGQEKTLAEKLSLPSEEKKRIAAISAVAAITQMYRHS